MMREKRYSILARSFLELTPSRNNHWFPLRTEMAVSFEPIRSTYEDYRHLPEDKRMDLIDGGFCITPSPTKKHQQVSGRIEFCLRQWVEEKELGEVFYAPFDVILSEYKVSLFKTWRKGVLDSRL